MPKSENCGKSDRCRNAGNCPYDFDPLIGFLCFDSNSVNLVEKALQETAQRQQKRKEFANMDIFKQIFTALNECVMPTSKIAEKSGIDPQIVRGYRGGKFPLALKKLVSVLEAAGYRLQVQPISGDEREGGE